MDAALDTYRKFLTKISLSISKDELEQMKFRTSCGSDEVDSAQTLFTMLEKKNKLSHNNMGYLKEILSDVERGDLRYKVEQFEEQHSSIKSTMCNVSVDMLHEDFMETTLTRTLEEKLKENNVVVVTGFLGSGKSQAALWYGSKRYKDEHSGALVWKLDGKDKRSLLSSLINLRQNLTKDWVSETEDEDAYINYLGDTICKLLGQSNALIIFDHIDCYFEEIRKIIGKLNKNQKCIVTTTNGLEFPNEIRIEAIGFTEEECLEFFKVGKGYRKQNEALYRQLAVTLSFSPFLLCGARTYMHQSIIGPKEMMKLIRKHPSSLIFTTENPFEPIYRYIEILRIEEGPKVFEMIEMLEFLDTEGIPITIFHFLPHDHEDIQTILSNSLVRAIQKFSFGNVTGEDENRLITIPKILHSALSKFRALPEQATKKALIVKLLKSLTWLFDKDNRTSKDDYNRNISLLPHATVLLSRAEKISDFTFEENVYLLYVYDLVSYNYNFLNRSSLCAKYSDRAIHLCLKLLNSSIIQVQSKDNLEQEAKTIAEDFFNAIEELHTTKFQELSQIAKQYVLNKHRVSDDIRAITNILEIEELEDEPRLTEDELKLLSEKNYTVPDEHLPRLFLHELVISLIYTYGRRLFYLPKNANEDLRSNFILHLFIARNLSNHVESISGAGEYRLLYGMLSERNGTLAIFFESKEEDKTLAGLRNAVLRLEDILKARTKYYVFGIAKMDSSDDDHHQLQCNKQLIRCYTTVLSKFKSEIDEQEISNLTNKGSQCASILLHLVDKVPSRSINRGIQIAVACFYTSIGQVQEALELYETACPLYFLDIKEKLPEKRPDKHDLSAAYGFVECCIARDNFEHCSVVLDRMNLMILSISERRDDFQHDLDKIASYRNKIQNRKRQC